ncbi:putative late blight resistance protein homolog R1A-10 [Coffea eugenioides]|uniref:Late blight resistance protein homolog R1A-10 n=1 Tax=Coffea arabica TaxID=13443 RepID=A0A6P6VC61_COFAR|nr:putative late blight resistance protein homolog R1A-10 [Coffea arabica]XP_027154368.1 putative late blight resistance protein homolog R1A-10 [Coffea eugenioides]
MESFGKLIKSENPTCTGVVDSLLAELDIRKRLLLSGQPDDNHQIGILIAEVRLWRMLLIYVAYLSDADMKFGVGRELGSMDRDLDAALKEATNDFRVASKKEGVGKISSDFGADPEKYESMVHKGLTRGDYGVAMSELQQKLMLFRPQMKAAYERIASNHSFQSHHPLSRSGVCSLFCQNLQQVVLVLYCGKGKMLEYMHLKVETMSKMLKRLQSFISTMVRFSLDLDRDFLTHFGALLVRTAHFCCLCWIDQMEEDKIEELSIMLHDLLKAFKLDTTEVVQLFLKLLRPYSLVKTWTSIPTPVETFVDFLFPEKDPQLETFFKGLEHLIMFVLEVGEPEKFDLKLLIMDITAAISRLGYFGDLFNEIGESTGYIFSTNVSAFFRLLEKIELLRVEVFLDELLKKRISLELLENRIDSFHEGLFYLESYQRYASKWKSKAPKLIWLHIKPVAGKAGSVYQSFHAKSVTEDKFKHELTMLHCKIQLLKTEILLEELLDGNPDLIINGRLRLEELLDGHPNLTVNVKNQMESLDLGLIVLRTYLMGPLEDDEKLILTDAESVARVASLFYYSLLKNDIAEHAVGNFSHVLPKLVRKMDLVNAKIKEIYMPVRRSSKSHFPKTEGFGFIDCLLGDLSELLNSEAGFLVSLRHQVHAVHRDLEFLRSFLSDIKEQYNDRPDLKSFVSSIIQVSLEAEYLIETFVVGNCLRWYHPLWLSDLLEDLNLFKVQATEICTNEHTISIHDVPTSSMNMVSPAKIPMIDEVVIDLTDEKKLIIDRLTAGLPQLDVVSIVGMPGLGKTTLALKAYNDPSVTYQFHARAWCYVSHTYRRRELLLQILGEIVELKDDILEMSDEDLEMKLYQCLKGKRYLIVMDDIWSTEAWYDFQRSFPNDNNGSRILITSRHFDVAVKLKADSTPHPLRLLSDDESWTLLQKKLFYTKKCPNELVIVGKKIAESCRGLPLAVVAISGLLERTDMIPDWWKQVSESICSHIVDDPVTGCMDILELSYRYLPNHLKPCFLYTGVFLEDKNIPVRKLTWLWIAEGFIPNNGLDSKEDVAEGYLRDLIGRSLVTASKRRSLGGVKTCHEHDMLRTLCLQKCEEENFLQWKNGYDELFPSSHMDLDYGVDPNYFCPPISQKYEKRRVSICSKRNHFVMSRPSGPHVQSLLYFATSDLYPRCPYDITFIFDNFKLLKVLDLESINMGSSFPTEVQLLVRLRFLALCGDIDTIPASISNLRVLESLLVKGLKGKVLLPYTLWSMEKLRHVHVNNYAAIALQDSESTSSSQALNLVSLSCPYLLCGKGTEDIMRKLLKLQKLSCVFSELRDDSGKCNHFPVLNFLTELESLNVLYSGRIALPCKFEFPLNLKKLTLSKFRLPWDSISEIGRLPNLEVLKLLSRAFEGKVWEMKGGEFLKLKFLKLDSLNVAQWNASSDHLPQLQHLILRSCRQLKEVPSGFAESCTLEMIEVQLCTHTVEESVKSLQDEQLGMGYELKVLIDHSDMDF